MFYSNLTYSVVKNRKGYEFMYFRFHFEFLYEQQLVQLVYVHSVLGVYI